MYPLSTIDVSGTAMVKGVATNGDHCWRITGGECGEMRERNGER